MTKHTHVAFDLETTGLYPRRDQILQIGAVAFTPSTEDCEEFSCLVRWDRVSGDPFALQMNASILKRIASGATIQNVEGPDDLAAVEARS